MIEDVLEFFRECPEMCFQTCMRIPRIKAPSMNSDSKKHACLPFSVLEQVYYLGNRFDGLMKIQALFAFQKETLAVCTKLCVLSSGECWPSAQTYYVVT